MHRNQAIAIVVVVALAAVAGTWWALHDGDATSAAQVRAPVLKPVTPLEQRADDHDRPWVDGEQFDPDFRELVSPGPIMDKTSEAYLKFETEFKVHDLEVSVDFKDATVKEVTAKLAELAKERGVKVWCYDGEIGQMVSEHRFTFTAEKVPFWTVIDMLIGHSNSRVKYAATSLGVVIGGEAAVQQAQLDANAATAKRLAAEDRKSDLLDVEFRPDFTDAKIWAIRNNIKLQTKVQVIVDEATWKNGHTMTWRREAMPLRDFLDEICEQFGCVYRIKDGRVFLLKR